jgi:hypothetical protein
MLMANRKQAVHYMANGFRMLSGGDHVLCAASGEAIELGDLRYWSVARQQAFASAELATASMMAPHAKTATDRA